MPYFAARYSGLVLEFVLPVSYNGRPTAREYSLPVALTGAAGISDLNLFVYVRVWILTDSRCNDGAFEGPGA